MRGSFQLNILYDVSCVCVRRKARVKPKRSGRAAELIIDFDIVCTDAHACVTVKRCNMGTLKRVVVVDR